MGNPNETFLQPKAHESSLHDKITSREPRAFILNNMSKKICVEIDGVFYETINLAKKKAHHSYETIKKRCLSNNFPNYKIVPFKVTYTEKRCKKCGKVRLLKEFRKNSTSKDGFRTECKECEKEYDKKYYKNNPDYQKEYSRRPRVKVGKSKRAKEKGKTDITYRINNVMSVVIRKLLKGKKNGAHWEVLVGWTVGEYKAHIESLFTEGMSWENYGCGKYDWSLDHIIAASKFNITSVDCQELKDCWALDNLQPLWHTRNMEKGNRPMEPKYLIKPF